MSDKHTTVITSDAPVAVMVDPPEGRWFRVFCSLVDSGAWARLSDAGKAVYVVLAKHCGPQWVAWPSGPTIAHLAGVSERQVWRATKELEGEGLISRRAGGGRKSTLYQLHDLPQTPSLPFPVREKSAVTPVSVQPCHPRHGSPVTPVRGTRPVEQDSLNSKQAAAAQKLTALGVAAAVARAAVEKFGPDSVVSAVAAVRGRHAVRNPPGLVLALLERGEVPAVKKSTNDELAAMSEMRRRQQLADERAAEAHRARLFGGGPAGRP